MSDAPAIGTWLRQQRLAVGMTQEDLADKSGVSVRTISNLECGRTGRPFPRSVESLAIALGVPDSSGNEWLARLRAGRAKSASPEAPRHLPAAVRHFIGRQTELDTLTNLLDAGAAEGTVVISAIDGMAGVGKTALAVHAAHRLAERFPDGQLFLDLHGYTQGQRPRTGAQAVSWLLRALGVPPERIPKDREQAAAFDLSYTSLDERHRQLWRRLGLIPGPDLDTYATAALDETDPATAAGLLEDLVDHNLLTEYAPSRYRLHDLLRVHARTHASTEPAPEREAATDRLLHYYAYTAQSASMPIARYRRPTPSAPTPAFVPTLTNPESAQAWLRAERDNTCALCWSATPSRSCARSPHGRREEKPADGGPRPCSEARARRRAHLRRTRTPPAHRTYCLTPSIRLRQVEP